MPPPKTNPRYIYKILDSPPPSPLPAVLPMLTDLDKNDGFVHLSTAQQTPLTATRFFSSHKILYLLKVRIGPDSTTSSPLAGQTKWELPPNVTDSDESNYFPHLYGSFGAGDVESIRVFERAEEKEESWLDVFGKGGRAAWLE